MIIKLTKNLVLFYQTILVILMLSVLGVTFYFWKLGMLDSNSSQNLHQTSYILESISKKNSDKSIKQIIFNENYKFALSSLKELEAKLDKVNNLVSLNSYEDLTTETQRVKVAVTNLISFPKIEKVTGVLNDKLQKFEQYVSSNKWNTLTRSSKRLLTITKGHINKEKIYVLVKNLNGEFDQMEKITSNSILSGADKSEIISRINNMRVETTMLKKYIDERSFLFDLLNNYNKSLNTWLSEINPEIALKKLGLEQVGKFYIFGLIFLFAMILLAFTISFFSNKYFNKKSQVLLEKRTKKYIQENIIEAQDSEMDNFSEDFRKFTFHTAKYVNKRMSFGAIFQESLPLASVLLDQNLKVIWANKHFSDQWLVNDTDVNKEYLSWDYLAKMTNIGEDDPVLEALKNGIAGIYQIQIKTSEHSQTQPFEMYVSPVKYNNQNRIQLFFYPLSSLQQTIKDQAMSIVGPIEKTLNLMLSNQYDEHYQDQLFRDYQIADIVEIHKMFNSLEESRKNERSSYLDELDMLHARLEKLLETINSLNIENTNIEVGTKNQLESLKTFKDAVIDLTYAGKTFEKVAIEANDLVANLLSAYVKMFQGNANFVGFISDCTGSFSNINDVKEELKSHRMSVSESRSRLSHSLSQFIHLKKKISDKSISERFNNTLNRTQDEFKLLDSATIKLEKKITAVEVILSKTQIIFENISAKVQEFNPHDFNSLYDLFAEKLKELSILAKDYDGVLVNNEDDIVSTLGEMFQETKNNRSHVKHAQTIMSPYIVKEFESIETNVDLQHPSGHLS